MLDVDAEHRNDDFVDFIGRNDHAKVARKRFVPGRTAERDAEQNFFADLHRFHTDVVGVFHRADETAAVVGNVELARQIVKRAVIDDDLAELLAERHHVNQLHRVNARRGIGGEITDVVRARAARVQTNALDAAEKFRRILRLDEAHLQIGARRDLDVTARQFLRQAAKFAELKSGEQSAGNPQTRHERILDRREKKQSVPFETKNLLLVRRLVVDGIFDDLSVGVERMQLALHAFLEN